MHNSSLQGRARVCVQSAKIHAEPTSTSQFCKATSVPYTLRERVEQELEQLYKVGVIEPVEFAEGAAPTVPVIKSDGAVQICRDYKVTVHRMAKVGTYPLSRIDDPFASLARGKLFSKLDQAHEYQQIPLAEESKKFIVINTHKWSHIYRYNRLPFRISPALATFQWTTEGILQGIPPVTVYIDDTLVISKTTSESISRICRKSWLGWRKQASGSNETVALCGVPGTSSWWPTQSGLL